MEERVPKSNVLLGETNWENRTGMSSLVQMRECQQHRRSREMTTEAAPGFAASRGTFVSRGGWFFGTLDQFLIACKAASSLASVSSSRV